MSLFLALCSRCSSRFVWVCSCKLAAFCCMFNIRHPTKQAGLNAGVFLMHCEAIISDMASGCFRHWHQVSNSQFYIVLVLIHIVLSFQNIWCLDEWIGYIELSQKWHCVWIKVYNFKCIFPIKAFFSCHLKSTLMSPGARFGCAFFFNWTSLVIYL